MACCLRSLPVGRGHPFQELPANVDRVEPETKLAGARDRRGGERADQQRWPSRLDRLRINLGFRDLVEAAPVLHGIRAPYSSHRRDEVVEARPAPFHRDVRGAEFLFRPALTETYDRPPI